MPKAKKLHPNTERLKSLISEYGVDKVMEATGYTLATLGVYTRRGKQVIPLNRLAVAEKFLKLASK